jgi:hypothetical protein
MRQKLSHHFSGARVIGLSAVVFVYTFWPQVATARGSSAQPPGSTIRGRITMDNGVIPASCTVVLTNTSNRRQQRANSDAIGKFKFERVPPGNYIVRACEGKSYGLRVESVRVDKEGGEKSVVIHEGTEGGGGVGLGGRGKRAILPCLLVTAENSPIPVKPDEAAYAKVLIQNNCNREGIFGLRVDSPAGTSAITYDDKNFDGKHQDEEPAVSTTKQLLPRGGRQQLLLRISIPATAWTEQFMKYVLSARSRVMRRASGHADIMVTKQLK